MSGAIQDALSALATRGALGEGLALASVPYSVVYHLEILALFATLVALGPLVAPRGGGEERRRSAGALGLADLPA